MITTVKCVCDNCHKTFTLDKERAGLRPIEVEPGVWKELCVGCALNWFAKKRLLREDEDSIATNENWQ